MSDTESLPRETGSAKTTHTCPTCGTELPEVTSAYGSTSAGACPNCTGDAKLEAEKAALAFVEEHGYPQGPPEEGWKADQLQKYAADKDIDLGGATKKSDMVAAINGQLPL